MRSPVPVLLLIAPVLLTSLPAGSGTDGVPGRGGGAASGSAIWPSRVRLNTNGISTVVTNFGILDIDEDEANAGLVFPKGSGKTAVYESGLLWGGIVDGELHVGGSAYRTGLQPGALLAPGVPDDPDLPVYRAYRVRPDYAEASLETELFEENLHVDTIRARYQRDWLEWPASGGAPFVDADHDGSYDPAVDTPGIAGAGQTIWYVANDNDSDITFNMYGSPPIGLEVQVTLWAYPAPGALGNTLFRKYRIINRSGMTIDSMYASPWSDPDVGTSSDDFVGCDTTLDLGFAYNGEASDAMYAPLPPPAVGYALLRGPLVESPGDTGVFEGQLRPGRKNLGMTAFYYFARGDASVSDPTQGSYEGTLQFYNFFRGRIGRTGEMFLDPHTMQSTPFELAGDPVAGTGWLDGDLLPPGDRRLGLSSGPFTMAPGDTQEVVVAEILGGAVPGVDRLSAVALMRFHASQVREFFDSSFTVTDVRPETGRHPVEFTLRQNYPNPFNPATRISYAIPRRAHVRLTVTNLLGQEVAVLADGVQEAGEHTAEFDASGLPGGVYFCRMISGDLTAEKKMVLMK